MNFGTVASPIWISYGGSGEASSKCLLFEFCRHKQASRLFIVGLRKSKANFAPCACCRIGETNSALDLHGGGNWVSTRSCRRFRGFGFSSQERNRGPKAQSDLIVPSRFIQCQGPRRTSVSRSRTPSNWACVRVMTPAEMMIELDDPMVLEHGLAMRAREKQEAVFENGVFENSVVDSPASGAMEVTEQVVGMETTPPALPHSPVSDDMSKHGDGAQSEAAQEEDLALPMKPNEGGIVGELPLESSSFSSPKSGNSIDNAGEGAGVAQKKRKERGKNWANMDTDDLLKAVSTTNKACTRLEQGSASDSYWDAIAKAVPGRTGHECRGRMDTLKRSFSTTKNFCDEQLKEFKQLSENDFGKMKVSPRLKETWYNQIRDYCPPKPKKKLKTNRAGGSTLDLQSPVLPDGIDQREPALAWRLEYGFGILQNEFVSTPCQGRSPSCDCHLNHAQE